MNILLIELHPIINETSEPNNDMFNHYDLIIIRYIYNDVHNNLTLLN